MQESLILALVDKKVLLCRLWGVFLLVFVKLEPGVALMSSIDWKNVCCLPAHNRYKLFRNLSKRKLNQKREKVKHILVNNCS